MASWIISSARSGSLAAASRYCAGEFDIADPLRMPDAFVNQLAEVTARVSADVVVPVTEPSLLAVLPQRHRITGALPFPDAAAFRNVCDKARVLATASRHGIAVPAQVVVESPTERAAAVAAARYPLVIKPSRSVVGSGDDLAKTSVLYASNATRESVG